MAAQSPRTEHARRLFAGVAPQYDLMSELLSFGQNALRWRRFLVSRLQGLPPRGRVLDVATGTAGVAIAIARRHAGANVVGLDQSEPMLRGGLRAVGEKDLDDRVHLVLGGAEALPFADASFDAVTFTYLLRYVDDPDAVVSELSRVLRPGGVLACLEFFVPQRRLWYAGWKLQTSVVLPLVGRVASPEWYRAGRFLSRSIPDFYRDHPLSEQGAWWRNAGIDHPRYRSLTLGAAIVIWGRKTGG